MIFSGASGSAYRRIQILARFLGAIVFLAYIVILMNRKCADQLAIHIRQGDADSAFAGVDGSSAVAGDVACDPAVLLPGCASQEKSRVADGADLSGRDVFADVVRIDTGSDRRCRRRLLSIPTDPGTLAAVELSFEAIAQNSCRADCGGDRDCVRNCLRLAGGARLYLRIGIIAFLETVAGPVRISDYSPGIEIYQYVATHTGASDYVLEIPYGGGINFASGRPNPIFDTMLFNMEIPPQYQQRDVERMEERPPKLVVAQDSPRFGTNFSFGAEGNRACICPRVVWKPDRPSFNLDHIYPLVGYIARNYHPVLRAGGKVILERNGLH